MPLAGVKGLMLAWRRAPGYSESQMTIASMNHTQKGFGKWSDHLRRSGHPMLPGWANVSFT
jgi:hypothetical protein